MRQMYANLMGATGQRFCFKQAHWLIVQRKAAMHNDIGLAFFGLWVLRIYFYAALTASQRIAQ